MAENNSGLLMKEIPAEDWVAWCARFTNGNRGRLFSIEFVGTVVGDVPLVEDLPLVAFDYDPVNKGNDFVVSYGEEAAANHHIIEAPVTLVQGQDRNDGEVLSLEIVDENGRRTILDFQD